MKLIYIPIVCLLFFIFGCASSSKRDKWIEQQITKLDESDWSIDSISTNKTMGIHEGIPCINYDIGRINFGDDSWIYIFAIHSWHGDQEIGDATLAIDIHKNVYCSSSHVCGGTTYIFDSHKDYNDSSSEDFFNRQYINEEEEEEELVQEWIKIR